MSYSMDMDKIGTKEISKIDAITRRTTLYSRADSSTGWRKNNTRK